jgi:hypothetical protein
MLPVVMPRPRVPEFAPCGVFFGMTVGTTPEKFRNFLDLALS